MKISLFKMRALACIALGFASLTAAAKIDRKALVNRHNPVVTEKNLPGPSQVGNGEIAIGVDLTGLQTYSDHYAILSNWAWHKFPPEMDPSKLEPTMLDSNGRKVPYEYSTVEFGGSQDQAELVRWMIANPHRVNLAKLGFIITKKDGSATTYDDVQNAVQKVDMYRGVIESTYEIEGVPVKVTTVAHPEIDAFAVKVESDKIADGTMGISIAFPYASDGAFSNGADWSKPDKHSTKADITPNGATFERKMDDTKYWVRLKTGGKADVEQNSEHHFSIMPEKGKKEMTAVVQFSPEKPKGKLPNFNDTFAKSVDHWQNFWETGGAIDLSESTDPRWFELERRVVLSQYVLAVNEAGSLPPQESGLVNNGWWGKFHYEMIWWHGTHYFLWDRDNLAKYMNVYPENLETWKKLAEKQGYDGVRWPKTIGGKSQWEWPNHINPVLIWQQPHPIFFAELDYRNHPTKETLEKWKDVVLETADFMASYAFYNKEEGRYVLGPPLNVVSENCDPLTTQNPTFELSYWRTGLRLAQEWRKRLGMEENPKYNDVIAKLSPLPVQDGVYVSWENIPDMWTRYNFEHPGLIGPYGMLPGDGVDVPTMDKTFKKVMETWRLDQTWGWDFPMLSMCAAKLGHYDTAIDLLLNYERFHVEQHGLVGGGGPFPYFPGNGGLLYAVAFLAAGWDGAPEGNAPGFPKEGWVVKWENLKKAL